MDTKLGMCVIVDYPLNIYNGFILTLGGTYYNRKWRHQKFGLQYLYNWVRYGLEINT